MSKDVLEEIIKKKIVLKIIQLPPDYNDLIDIYYYS